jgi:Plasmid encoded RepA protein
MTKCETEIKAEPVIITAPDLLEQLETAYNVSSDPKLRRRVEERLQRVQAERNATEKRRAEMTPVQRRRDLAKESIANHEIEQDDIHHIHSVLALCALPYKRPPEDVREYDVNYGFLSLGVEAGRLLDPHTGKWVRQGIPYGPKARLMQLHICTRAIRQKSPEVELESSMSAFMRSLGFAVTGGTKGSIAQFKEQLNRLAACRMQIGIWNGKNAAKTTKIDPIKSFDVWFPDNPEQRMLWPSKVVLHRDFYESLEQHALPVDIRSLSALSHSAKQMDLLLWLSYRVHELDKKYFLTWKTIQKQFCQSETMRPIDFEKRFKDDIDAIGETFDTTLPIDLTEKGLWLKPSDPAKLFVPPKKLLR